MARILAIEEIIRHMHLAKTHARHTFRNAVRPPSMMEGHVKVPTVARFIFAVANQIAELMPRRGRGVAELCPRNRHIVRSVGNIQVAIVAVVNIHMVNPHILGFVIHLKAIFIIVIVSTNALEFQITDNDIAGTAQLHGATRRRLGDNSPLIAINGNVTPHFNGTHVSTGFYVNNLVARLGVGLKVCHIVHRDLGFALATCGATILSCKTRHRKVRRSHCKRRNRSRCDSQSRESCGNTNRLREQIIHSTSLFSLNLSRRTRKRIKKEPHTTQSVLYRQLHFYRKKNDPLLARKGLPPKEQAFSV